MSLLKLDRVTKRFGGLLAVDHVSLEIEAGELIAIVGPNGAGKTTLFNIMSGVFIPDEGRVIFEGRDISRLPPYKRAPLGIGRTFQIPRPFSSATVRENIAIGAMFGTLGKKVSVDESLKIADRYIDMVGLQLHRGKAAGSLTPVEKKMMEIARALAMNPKLLLMDEAMAGMNPKDIDHMVAFLMRIKDEEKISVIAMVEHIMRAVAGLAERVMVMHQGAKLVDAATTEALSDPRVVEVYFGGAPKEFKKNWKKTNGPESDKGTA
ncbi:MAG: ABC transporter ATP-binding protein [Deltaproteobacteria bacterium]|nr:ABC transporter ATP-binding protein [Deltaproteobacteria bacterium]MBW2019765.1 ABC transporter ATP-binding protein [Deltaproteobacteria bacterium]MBW2074565.1 ABC transporter ATP-binding protein [Deltaproteobacteria bacterium]RLB83427.1 MAG: ABC transporter ATP-binding protein [Deltaproteobacteria bacterium]